MVKKFNTYGSELSCSNDIGAEFSLPEKVTVVLVADYDALEAALRDLFDDVTIAAATGRVMAIDDPVFIDTAEFLAGSQTKSKVTP